MDATCTTDSEEVLVWGKLLCCQREPEFFWPEGEVFLILALQDVIMLDY